MNKDRAHVNLHQEQPRNCQRLPRHKDGRKRAGRCDASTPARAVLISGWFARLSRKERRAQSGEPEQGFRLSALLRLSALSKLSGSLHPRNNPAFSIIYISTSPPFSYNLFRL